MTDTGSKLQAEHEKRAELERRYKAALVEVDTARAASAASVADGGDVKQAADALGDAERRAGILRDARNVARERHRAVLGEHFAAQAQAKHREYVAEQERLAEIGARVSALKAEHGHAMAEWLDCQGRAEAAKWASMPRSPVLEMTATPAELRAYAESAESILDPLSLDAALTVLDGEVKRRGFGRRGPSVVIEDVNAHGERIRAALSASRVRIRWDAAGQVVEHELLEVRGVLVGKTDPARGAV
jgi:hypothetical protein